MERMKRFIHILLTRKILEKLLVFLLELISPFEVLAQFLGQCIAHQ
jgi:hypothetical protein